MVALKKYARIESEGLWRSDPDAQRREVIVVLGDATLTIKTVHDQVLGHWSIAAIKRLNPGKTPAQYCPDGDPGEELELGERETEMIEAIETLRRAVERARPHPGRLRGLGLAISVAVVAAAGVFWLPGALVDHALGVVHQVGRAEIGQALITRVQRVTGPACGTSATNSSLARLASRLDVPVLAVMRGGVETALALPGGHIVLSRKLLEDFEEPDVAAGFILAAQTTSRSTDPLRDILDRTGTMATFRLLTTGHLPEDGLDDYSEYVLTRAPLDPALAPMLAAFETAGVRSTPYAYARDITGETVLDLIEGDPMRGKPSSPLLSDADWLRLQAICDG